MERDPTAVDVGGDRWSDGARREILSVNAALRTDDHLMSGVWDDHRRWIKGEPAARGGVTEHAASLDNAPANRRAGPRNGSVLCNVHIDAIAGDEAQGHASQWWQDGDVRYRSQSMSL